MLTKKSFDHLLEVDFSIREDELFSMDLSHYHSDYELYYLLDGERYYDFFMTFL